VQSDNLQKAYVLHARPYRETSLLVDLLSEGFGRVSVVARGVRRKKSSLKGLLEPFVLLEVSWFGRSELVTLKNAEAVGSSVRLTGKNLLSGMYVNELLTRVLHRHDPCAKVFAEYENIIAQLSCSQEIEINLRRFEKKLLQLIGYEIPLTHLADLNQPIVSEKDYLYTTDNHFVLLQNKVSANLKHRVFNGKCLLAFAADDYADNEVLRAAKRLMRLAFLPLLGGKPLKSRELFV
jgi:DNA repair protein RecO (recombination protein O)